MKISLCNEVLREMDFGHQCDYAAKLGYDGVELAPFTLSENPHQLAPADRAEIRRVAEEAGVPITGLHWLLITPDGLSLTVPDAQVRQRTKDVMLGLVELCSDLGGKVLIHGSPNQRMIGKEDRSAAEKRARDIFSEVAEEAEKAGVRYCVEPLAPSETDYINNLGQAVELVEQVGNPAFRTMLDIKAASTGEERSVIDLIDKWLPTGRIAHVHFNDSNLRGPGQGQVQFTPILKSLLEHGYSGVIGVEPFDYYPDPRGSAARAIGYIRGVLEAISHRP